MAYTKDYIIDFNPNGSTVKVGIEYCDNNIDDLVTNLNAHEALTTNAHGVGTWAIVGEGLTQGLYNKTLHSATISGGTITGAITGTGATITGGTISGATITGGSGVNQTITDPTITGTVTASGATITGATIAGGTIAGGTIAGGTSVNQTIQAPTLTGTVTASGATITGGSTVNQTITNPTITGGTIQAATVTGGTFSNPTLTGTITGIYGVPTGCIMAWPTNTAPDGWLLCYGQAVSRTTYANLFSLLSTTFGNGDGSTTFNLPDLRGRVPLGQDDMGGSSAGRVVAAEGSVLGGSGGAETHTLTTSEMPAHTHTLGGSYASYATAYQGSYFVLTNLNNANTGSTGGGNAHNNMPPYITLNYIIRT